VGIGVVALRCSSGLGAGAAPGTYSTPSTLAVNLSFHSMAMFPSYLSLIVTSSQAIPAATLSGWFSKNALHGPFPPSRMRSISAGLKASMVIERTKEMCTPRPRCTPAQDRQRKMPSLGEAHWGEGEGQSMQRVLELVLEISRS
jgi:hypothetical protein